MIQFNLLPDVKQQFIKARRLKRLVIVVSIAIAGVSLAIFLFFLILVDVAQKKSISDLTSTINKDVAQVEKTPNLNTILTVQNQLKSLVALHQNKPVVSRLFGYIGQITPTNLTLSDVKVDFTTDAITFSGNADSLATVNTFVDTLKYTTYSLTTTPSTSTGPNAFTQVVLTGFSYSSSSGASFTVNTSFNPAIFGEAADATITVPPNEITTRATLGLPTPIFTTPPSSTSSTNSTSTTSTSGGQ